MHMRAKLLCFLVRIVNSSAWASNVSLMCRIQSQGSNNCDEKTMLNWVEMALGERDSADQEDQP